MDEAKEREQGAAGFLAGSAFAKCVRTVEELRRMCFSVEALNKYEQTLVEESGRGGRAREYPGSPYGQGHIEGMLEELRIRETKDSESKSEPVKAHKNAQIDQKPSFTRPA